MGVDLDFAEYCLLAYANRENYTVLKEGNACVDPVVMVYVGGATVLMNTEWV